MRQTSIDLNIYPGEISQEWNYFLVPSVDGALTSSWSAASEVKVILISLD